jgi:predicted ester cyclase
LNSAVGADVAEASKDLVRRLFEDVFNEQRLDLTGEIMAEEYAEHAVEPFGGQEPGQVQGPSHQRGVVEWLRAQFPDLRMRIQSIIAEGELVAVRIRSEGTNLGSLGGVAPPTGKRFAAEQSHWYRVADGRLCEHWATRDDLSAMLQLGVIRPPGRPN